MVQSNIPMGPWTLKPSELIVEHTNGYYVDLERCTTSAELLDWIFQLQSKSWVSYQDMGQLLDLLSVALDPQATLCSAGKEQGPLSGDQIARMVRR